MPKQSAGILAYRISEKELQVFLVHPGGPFWAKKDNGAWSVPKGEFLADEDPLTAAKREFKEETGQPVNGNFKELSPIKLKSGKTVFCWAVEANVDAGSINSNYFDLEWPPKSGRIISIPEVDRAEWFDVETAKVKINQAQVEFIRELERMMQNNM